MFTTKNQIVSSQSESVLVRACEKRELEIGWLFFLLSLTASLWRGENEREKTLKFYSLSLSHTKTHTHTHLIDKFFKLLSNGGEFYIWDCRRGTPVGDGRRRFSGGRMGFDSGIPMSRPIVTAEVSSSLSPPLDEDALWQLNLRSREAMESGPYPVREGEPDCSYYIRTGLCRFGATCRFNHPPNRKLAIATAKMRGEYPERTGQPECQYYLRTGTCKFGATCKFHHPRDKAGMAGQVSLNVLGYPLRPNEAECAYYLRTGQCKFGNTCKFHHPQPTNLMVTFRGSPVYPTVQSPTSPGGITNWSLSRASYVPSPRWQPPSNYPQMILPQGVVSVPGWNAYNGPLGSLSSSESLHQTSGTSQMYATSRQSETPGEPLQGAYSSYLSGYYALPRENVFPERPGQPDCQFYIKTGDCKFGAVCRFHHPTERRIPAPDCVLSPIGLPLRPGEPLCIFYSRYGICKFGPSCKFDHPMGVFTYNFSASTSAAPSGEGPVPSGDSNNNVKNNSVDNPKG